MTNDLLMRKLAAIEASPERDALLNDLSMRMLSSVLSETIRRIAGQRLDFVLILGNANDDDSDTTAIASTSNMDPEAALDLVMGWLTEVVGKD